MSQAYKIFPPPSRGRARVGVKTLIFHDFTPIPTFPLKRGRSQAIEQAPSPASKVTYRRWCLRHEFMRHIHLTSPPLNRGRIRACPVLDTGVGVESFPFNDFTPIPTFPLKRGRSIVGAQFIARMVSNLLPKKREGALA